MFKFLTYIIFSNYKALIAFVAPLVYQRIRERYELQKVRPSAKFEFIQAFLKDDMEQKHPLVVEQAFLNYLGQELAYEEIMFLSKLSNPTSAFRSFIKARNYLAYDPVEKTMMYRGRYRGRSKKRLKWIMRWHLFLYLFFAMAGLYPLLYSYELLSAGGLKVLPSLTLIVILLLAAAYLQLGDIAGLHSAEKLVNQINARNGET